MEAATDLGPETLIAASTLADWAPWLFAGVTAIAGTIVGHWLSGSSQRRTDLARLYEDLLLALRMIARAAPLPRGDEDYKQRMRIQKRATRRAQRTRDEVDSAAEIYERIQLRHGESPAVGKARPAVLNAHRVSDAWSEVKDVNLLVDDADDRLAEKLRIVNSRVAVLMSTTARFAIAARIEARGRGPKWLRHWRAERRSTKATINTPTVADRT